jgi:ribonuclease E
MNSDSSEERSELPTDTLFAPEAAPTGERISGPAEAAPADDSGSGGKPRRRRRGGRGRGGRGRGKSVRRKAPSPAAEPPESPALIAPASDGPIVQAQELPAPAESAAPEPVDVSEARAVDQPVPTSLTPSDDQASPSGAPEEQKPAAAGPAAPASGSTGSAGYAIQRPNPNRLVARVAPGLTRHAGRRSFSQGKVRHQFRPTGPARSISSSGISETLLSDIVAPAPVHHHPGRRQTDPARRHPAVDSAATTPAEPAADNVDNAGHVDNPLQSPPVPEDISTAALDADNAAQNQAEAEERDELDAEVESPRPVARKKGPPRIMLVNVADSEEVRIAIVSQGVLEGLYTERSSHDLHVGNIYKGRVTNVEPSIQAAFIDFGIGKNGFLHISDLHPQYFPQHHKSTAKFRAAGAKKADAPPTADEPVEPDAAANFEEMGSDIDDRFDEDADIQVDNDHIAPMERVGRKTPRHSRPPIQQCLRRGQEIIVQVTKEGIGTKGPTLTSYISVPGRYLVMMPGMSALGVSRKIEDDQQRRAMKHLLRELNPPENLGFIIRTAGMDRTARELQQDLHFLVRIWKRITHRLDTQRTPALLYEESDLVIRSIRDLAVQEMDRIVVDDADVAERVRDFLTIASPDSSRVELYEEPMPLFIRYGVEREIEKINSRRVEMANGGSLVIDSTEALVAVDVNSGRYREQRDAELTAYNINKEAIADICRQLRLRDLGGVIVIDFIDMREERHKREIERLLRDELRHDRAKTKVLRMSQFCMIEMTRQRVKPSLKRGIYQDCPHCRGAALIKTPESVTLDVMRRLAAATLHKDIARIELKVYPTVAGYLLNKKRRELVTMEDRTEKKIIIAPDPALPDDSVLIEAYDARGNLMNIAM